MAFLVPDSVETWNGVTVKKHFLTEHNPNKISLPSKRTKTLIGVTVHNTDKIKVSGTTCAEQYTRATVNGNMNTVRVHFYVDGEEAWQNLPLNYQSWHAADGSGDGNTATISIECIMGNTNDSKAEDNCARLVAHLLKENGLTTKDVYTHTYWLNVRDGKGANLSKDARCTLKHTYKVCPIYIIPHWESFLKNVNHYMDEFRYNIYGQLPYNSCTDKTEMGIIADVCKKVGEIETDNKKMHYVQVGAFSDEKNAKEYLEKVKKDYPDAFIKTF